MGSVTTECTDVASQAQKHVNPGLAPNLCKTPGPPVPVPYPAIGDTSSITSPTDNCKIENKPTMNLDSKSNSIKGNEAGVAGGDILTNKHAPTQPKASATVGSMTVSGAGKGFVKTGSMGFTNHG